MILDRQQSLGVTLLIAGTLAIALSNRDMSPNVGDRNIGQVPVHLSSAGGVELTTSHGPADKLGDLFVWHCVNHLPAPLGLFLLRDTIDWTYGSACQDPEPQMKAALAQAFEESRGRLASDLAVWGPSDLSARLRDGRLDLFRPCWPPVILCFGLGVLGTGCARLLIPTHGQRALRRVAHGECPGCGYSTAGLEEVAMCPECGAARSSWPPPAYRNASCSWRAATRAITWALGCERCL